MNKVKDLLKGKATSRDTLTLLTILAILLVFIGGMNPKTFFSLGNVKNIALQVAEYGCFSTAFFLTCVCGGMNFACVTTGNLAAIVMATVYANAGLNAIMPQNILLLVSVLAALGTGILCGTLIALLVSRCRLTQLLATICATRLFEGLSFLITKGSSAMAPTAMLKLGTIYVFGVVPLLLLITIGCFIICGVYLNKTRYGRQTRLYGLNKVANIYSGIDNEKTLIVTYSLSGMLSAVGGMNVMCMFGAIKPDFGTSLTAMIMLIVLLSGIVTTAGDSKVVNVFIACLCVQIINTGLSLGGSTTYVAEFVCGLMLLVVIIISCARFKTMFGGVWKRTLFKQKISKGGES